MKKKYTYYKVLLSFLLLGIYTTITAQSICSTSTATYAFTELNASGGSNDNDGLRLKISGSGNLQVYSKTKNQIFGSAFSTNSNGTNANAVPGTTNGFVLTIGNSGTTVNNYSFRSGSLTTSGSGTSQIKPASVICTENGDTQERQMTFNLIRNLLTYSLTVTYSYTFPNNYFTIKYSVIIPAAIIPEEVKISHGWDTYLDGGDSGPGFITGVAPKFTMGVQKTATVSGVEIKSYEAFKYKSGIAWSGYYSAIYSSLTSDLGSSNTFTRKIDTSPNTDNGIGISINFGSASGTYISESDVIFRCNAPTAAPTFSATTATATCGKPVNLSNLYNGTTALTSGVTVKYYDSSGNEVSPTAISAAGIYTAYYVDANNAGCTSPGTQITVTQVACCSTTPTLVQDTISNTCPTETVDLTKLYEGALPTNVSIKWYNNSTHTGAAIADPTKVTTGGTYYAFINDTGSNCFSPPSRAVTVTINTCCRAGYVAPLTN